MENADVFIKLRQRKGFALYWWWKGWSELAIGAYRCGAPAWLVNALAAVGSW